MRKPRRDLATCLLCGRSFKKGNTKHANGAECTVAQTYQRYAERGWGPVGQATVTIERAGFPVERAPVAVEPGYRGPSTVRDGPWAPVEAIKALRLLSGVKVTPVLRARLVRKAALDPEFFKAIDAALRLNAWLPKEWGE